VEEKGTGRVRNNRGRSTNVRGAGGEVVLHGRADAHKAACGGPHATAGEYTLNKAAAHEEPMLERRKGVRRNEQQRETILH